MEIQGAEDYWLRGRLVINKAGQEDRSQIIQQNEIYLRPTLCQGSHTEIQIRHDFCPKGSHNLVVKWSFWICCQSSLLQVDPSLYSIYIQSPLSLESDRVVKKKKCFEDSWLDGWTDGWMKHWESPAERLLQYLTSDIFVALLPCTDWNWGIISWYKFR